MRRNRQPRPLYHDGFGIFFDEPPITQRERRLQAWGFRALWFGMGLVVGAVLLREWVLS